jgi:hypothetical protein
MVAIKRQITIKKIYLIRKIFTFTGRSYIFMAVNTIKPYRTSSNVLVSCIKIKYFIRRISSRMRTLEMMKMVTNHQLELEMSMHKTTRKKMKVMEVAKLIYQMLASAHLIFMSFLITQFYA